MKTLILYATKYGAAKEIAERIAKLVPESTTCDVKSDSIPPISDYDCIIIGSSLYAGTIRKEAKAFLSANTDALKTKRIGLFLAGMSPAEESSYFETNFPPDLVENAIAKSLVGGVFDPQKSGVFERMIMKAVTKQSGYINTISDERIEKFAETLLN